MDSVLPPVWVYILYLLDSQAVMLPAYCDIVNDNVLGARDVGSVTAWRVADRRVVMHGGQEVLEWRSVLAAILAERQQLRKVGWPNKEWPCFRVGSVVTHLQFSVRVFSEPAVELLPAIEPDDSGGASEVVNRSLRSDRPGPRVQLFLELLVIQQIASRLEL